MRWRSVRLRRLVTTASGSWGTEPEEGEVVARCVRGTDFDYSVLGVNLDRAPLRGFRAAEYRSRSACRGDLIIEKSGGGEQQPVGRVVLYDGDDPVMPTNFAGRLRPMPGINSPFLCYLMASLYTQGRTMAAVKQTTGIQNLDLEALLNEEIRIPEEAGQQAIADYLDCETARIDSLVTTKRRMAELLEERRRAMRDLAFNCAPGWRLKRLLARSMAYGVLVPDFVEPGTGVPMIRTYNLSARGYVSHEDIAEIPVELAGEYRRTSLSEGDLILSVVGSMGRSAVVSAQEQGFNLNRPLARLQLRPEVPPRLIWHWTQTTHFLDMAKLATGGGTAQPTLNLGDLANFRVGLPGETNLWPAVLAELEEGCRRLDETEDVLNRQIGLLQERRQALITAAVAGELEIPEAA